LFIPTRTLPATVFVTNIVRRANEIPSPSTGRQGEVTDPTHPMSWAFVRLPPPPWPSPIEGEGGF
jgi:hypothetical protein